MNGAVGLADDDFYKIQDKWQRWWLENKTFCVSDYAQKPKYYVLDMFPYPSGEGLHVGHPVGYIASDIIARYKMLQGYEVLHPMGFDAFGLPAEQFAIQTGQHPARSTEANIKVFRRQLRSMGLAYDHEREIRTCDPAYYKWTQWAFVQMFHHWFDEDCGKARPISELVDHFARRGSEGVRGATHRRDPVFTAQQWRGFSEEKQQDILEGYRLAYREEALVNWCAALGTVLAHDEIEDGLSVRGGHPVSQKMVKQWKLRVRAYGPRLLEGLEKLQWPESTKRIQRHWIGRSVGAQVLFKARSSTAAAPSHPLPIYTTRVDTIYGVTFVVLAPEHPLVPVLTAESCRKQMDEYRREAEKRRLSAERFQGVVSGCWTGAYAEHPLSGEQLPIWVSDYVLMDYGSGAIMAVPADDERDGRFAKHFSLAVKSHHTLGTPLEGLERAAAQQCALELLQAKGLAQPCVSYRLKDAIFARQRYWGEPIPIYYRKGVPYALDVQDLPLELPAVDAYLPTEAGEPPLARAENWCNAAGDVLEVNTMPGFAGSSAYFLRYMDPGNTEALVGDAAVRYWRQVDLYIGGAEHATGHLIYSRFWNMFLYDLGVVVEPEPFAKLLHQGMMLAPSQYVFRIKGTGTIVSAGLHQNYDTQRLPVSVALVRDRVLDREAFRRWRSEFADAEFILEGGECLTEEVVEKMSKSLFNTISPDDIIQRYGADTLRLYEMFLGPLESTGMWSSEKIEGVHRFLKRFWRLFFGEQGWQVSDHQPTTSELRLLHHTICRVREHTENYQFNVAIAELMNAVNELTKSACFKREMLSPLVILLAPYAPHICEELYERLGGEPSLFHHGKLPEHDPRLLASDVWQAPVAFGGKVRFTMELDENFGSEEIKAKVQAHPLFGKYAGAAEECRWIIVPQKMINIVIKKNKA